MEEPLPIVAEEDDVANGEEEEAFDVGMRQNAIDFRVADADADNKLDFDEFCAMVREREEGEHTREEPLARCRLPLAVPRREGFPDGCRPEGLLQDAACTEESVPLDLSFQDSLGRRPCGRRI